MEYDSELSLLSPKFIQDYPPDRYPELMYKQGRPYTCLLIGSHDDYFICVPFRSSIGHKNAFLFTETARSKKSKSGLDYSKTAIIKDTDYLDATTKAIIDQDEYTEMMRNLSAIVLDVNNYINTYIDHISGASPMQPRAYARKYQYSTLPYFHDILLKQRNIVTTASSGCIDSHK